MMACIIMVACVIKVACIIMMAFDIMVACNIMVPWHYHYHTGLGIIFALPSIGPVAAV